MSETTTDKNAAAAGGSQLERLVILPLPDGMQCMESGPVQFDVDWPGIFIRGDSAAGYAMVIEDLLRAADNDKLDAIVAVQAEHAVKFFRSCLAI